MKAADYKSIVSVIPKEGLGGPIRQSLFGYDTDKDRTFAECDTPEQKVLLCNDNVLHFAGFSNSDVLMIILRCRSHKGVGPIKLMVSIPALI